MTASACPPCSRVRGRHADAIGPARYHRLILTAGGTHDAGAMGAASATAHALALKNRLVLRCATGETATVTPRGVRVMTLRKLRRAQSLTGDAVRSGVGGAAPRSRRYDHPRGWRQERPHLKCSSQSFSICTSSYALESLASYSRCSCSAPVPLCRVAMPSTRGVVVRHRTPFIGALGVLTMRAHPAPDARVEHL